MDDLLLPAGHLLGRHLHAEVAARHHDAVAKLDQLVQAVERGGLFDLGHDGGAIVDQLLGVHHVLGPLDEGQRHPIDAQVEAEQQVLPVLLGDRRNRQDDARDIDALAVAQGSANLDPSLGMVGPAGDHLEP